jgi:predicted  nucleic acid-binding Zn-ribbon protein
MSYDEEKDNYIHTLEAEFNDLMDEVNKLRAEIVELRFQLSDSHRQISVLQGQLIHYYL